MDKNEFLNLQKTNEKRAAFKLLILFITLVFFLIVSFGIGRFYISPFSVVKIIASKVFPFLHINPTWTAIEEVLVLQSRLPRLILCILAGSSLSISGAVYQAMFQNPMCSPDILGATNGAALGAVIALSFNLPIKAVFFFSFALGLISVFITYVIAEHASGNSTVNLILTGVMLSSLLSALISYIKFIADPTTALASITYWLMGRFSNADISYVGFAIIPIIFGVFALVLLSGKLNLLSLGAKDAQTLGVNVKLYSILFIVFSTLITTVTVATSGVINWIGLVIPHITRKIMGDDYKYVLPGSALIGSIFLLLIDNISRVFLVVEIPLGILSSFVGAPFFIYLLFKKDRVL